jgi:hypothetical protein
MAARMWKSVGLAGVGLVCCGYVAYPCVTLYRLDSAVSRGDTDALRSLVDWPDVRRGIEADLAQDGGELAPFGASFMRTVAVKAAMTPDNVMQALQAAERRDTGAPSARLRGVRVEGPCTVIVDLGTVRLRMHLRNGEWRVTRAWLPGPVLENARAIARR